MERIFRILVVMVLCLMSSLSHSRHSYYKLWGLVTYNSHYEKLLYILAPELRLVDRPNKYDQSLFNAGAGYQVLPRLQVWLGQTITNFADRGGIVEDVSAKVRDEYRIWEQILWSPSTNWVFRTRFEERHSFNSSRWSMRFRNRTYWTIPFSEKDAWALSDEVFINVKKVPWVRTGTFNENRAYIGIAHAFTHDIILNISYMNQYIARTSPGIEDNHAIVLNLFVNMFD
ncbi:MAG: DUF2490 domain-containing protein [Gammaproteobacteria bacterium]|nr:DUF2490 domain-containing protein [Gammaproteobacteria bacterium]